MFRLTSALLILASTALFPSPAEAALLSAPLSGQALALEQAPLGLQQAPAQTPAADPEFDAAARLKSKAAYAEAAAAFEAWVAVHPNEPRTGEALNEAAVCWYIVGRTKLKNLRGTPESRAMFEKALALFDKTLKLPSKDQGGRAQYMRGWVKFVNDDVPGAIAEYDLVLDKWKDDAKYVPKALNARAMAHRTLMQTPEAVADLQRYVKEYPQGDDIAAVKSYLEYCRGFDKPALPFHADAWIQGDPTTLAAMRGDVVLLYFFATWCPHCEEVRPAMIDLADHYGPIGVHVIGIVNESQGQTVETVKAMLPTKGYKFPVLFDAKNKTSNQYNGSKIPDVVLIDRAGRVRYHDNANNLHEISIETLLLEDPPPGASKPSK